MNKMNIGKNLKTLRKLRNMTQSELAAKIEVSTDHISHAEIGYGTLSLTRMLEICKLLEVTPNDILSGEYEPESEHSLQDEIIPLKEVNHHNAMLLLKLYQIMKEEEQS